jgi:arsenate reductase-like glutaredoxin family protein
VGGNPADMVRVIRHLVENPADMQRPIAVFNGRGIIGRPAERVLEILE